MAERYNKSNTIKITNVCHQLWDARLISFTPHGNLVSSLPPDQLRRVGLSTDVVLPQSVLNQQRVDFLKRRINDYSAFVVAKEMALAVERERAKHEEVA